MTTAIMPDTARSLSETYTKTHQQLIRDGGVRSQVWQEYVDSLKSFDVNDPNEVIEAKAALDTLEVVLIAASQATSELPSKF